MSACDDRSLHGRSLGSVRGYRFPLHHPPVLHYGRLRWWYRLQQGRVRGNLYPWPGSFPEDRKSTRLNSSHVRISYAVFCLKKKKKKILELDKESLTIQM